MPRRAPLLVSLDMLSLERNAERPLHRQIYDHLRHYILNGQLPSRTRLPATRTLAGDLGVSRNTIVAAYDALLAEGYLESIQGSGTQVADLPSRALIGSADRRASALPRLSARGNHMISQIMDRTIPERVAFHPGYPEIQSFPFSTWARLLAINSRRVNDDLYGYHHVGGHPKLRSAIATYLAISRGVKCGAEQVIVLTGAQAALDVIGRLFMDPGDAFWIEDPGYQGARIAFQGAGGTPVPLHVAPEGWQVDEAATPPPRLIYVTPSCQWPLGMVMPLETRLRLLHLAERHDAWIIEDDYDSEFRFRGHPVPSMQGLDRSGRVIYVGTMSKMMFPSLRLGYIVVPTPLVEGFKAALSATGQYPSLPLQAALADFIGEGFLAAHLRRMRSLYARRQRHFVKLCQARLGPWLDVHERDTGMQVSGRFRMAMDDADVNAAAMRRGIHFVRMSSQYYHSEPVHGAFLGYAGVGADETEIGIERLRNAFEEVQERAGQSGRPRQY